MSTPKLAVISRNKADFLTMLNTSNLSINMIVIVPKQVASDYSYGSGLKGKVYYAFCFHNETNFSNKTEPYIRIIPQRTLRRNYISSINENHSELFETIVFIRENSETTSIKPYSINEKNIHQAEKSVIEIIDFASKYNNLINKTDAVNTPEFRNNYHFWD